MTRVHVASERPGVTADVIVAWTAGADPRDIEDAIKAAARRAVLRYREEAGVGRG